MASVLIAFTLCLGWCVVAVRIGPRLGFVDVPERSALTAHEVPAVPLGGVGVFLGVTVAFLWEGTLSPGLLMASGMVLLLGLADDRWDLPPVSRLIVEFGAAVVLVVGVPGIDGLSDRVFATLLVVVAINAVNLYDGLDGLVGLTTLVTTVVFAALFLGRGLDTAAPLILGAAMIGFLVLNWAPARLFLGDAGSYLVGLYLAYVILTAGPSGWPDTLVATAVLGLFIVDLVAAVLRRLRSRTGIFSGDRNHLYDQMRRRLVSVPKVALLSGLGQLAFGLVLIGVDQLPAPAKLGSVAALAVVILVVLARSGSLAVGEA